MRRKGGRPRGTGGDRGLGRGRRGLGRGLGGGGLTVLVLVKDGMN